MTQNLNEKAVLKELELITLTLANLHAKVDKVVTQVHNIEIKVDKGLAFSRKFADKML